jgi:ribosomal protein S18 acetylase RimI-like enzyme
MQVRIAVPADAAGVAEAQVASWRSAYRGIMPDAVLENLDVDESAQRWRERLERVPGAMLVCEAEPGIIGFAASGPTRDDDGDPQRVAEVYAIYVAPQWWGAGAGYALWKATRAKLADDGFAEMVVWVLEANHRARAFYERVGCRLDGGASKQFEAAPGVMIDEVRYRSAL